MDTVMLSIELSNGCIFARSRNTFPIGRSVVTILMLLEATGLKYSLWY